MREAAALPLISITAWDGLADRAQLKAGQMAAPAASAMSPVQLARALGAEVFATGSLRSMDLIKQFGAVPINYNAHGFSAIPNRYLAARPHQAT
jgi:NADPH:quinone reductase